jgi:hypothetical protein
MEPVFGDCMAESCQCKFWYQPSDAADFCCVKNCGHGRGDHRILCLRNVRTGDLLYPGGQQRETAVVYSNTPSTVSSASAGTSVPPRELPMKVNPQEVTDLTISVKSELGRTFTGLVLTLHEGPL